MEINKFRKVLVTFTAAAVMTGMVAGSALAAQPQFVKGKDKKNQWPPAQASFTQKSAAKGKANAKTKFVDVNGHWAQGAMLFVSAPGMVRGYDDSTFRPNNTITKNESLTMIIRMMGLEGKQTKKALNPKVAKKVPSWMQGNLALAVEYGLITDKELASYNGSSAARRDEVAAWMARAAGLSASDDMLPFRDAGAVSVQYRAHVAAMYRAQIMSGYQGNYFKPGEPIKRAEMASLMMRLMTQCPINPDYRAVQGTVKSVDDDSISLNAAPYKIHPRFVTWQDLWNMSRDESYSFADDVTVYLDGKAADIEDIDDGDSVLLLLDGDGEVIVILASSGTGIGQDDEDDTSDLNVESFDPDNGAKGVDPNTTSLKVVFEDDIQAVDGLDDGVIVKNVTDNDSVDIDEVNISGDTLTIELEKSLEDGKKYSVSIKEGLVADEDDEDIVNDDIYWTFNTDDESGPVVLKNGLYPADGDNDVDADDVDYLKVYFNEDIEAVDNDLSEVKDGIAVTNLDTGDELEIDVVVISGNCLKIKLDESLDDDTEYEVTIEDDVIQDEDGNYFDGIDDEEWTFTTEK